MADSAPKTSRHETVAGATVDGPIYQADVDQEALRTPADTADNAAAADTPGADSALRAAFSSLSLRTSQSRPCDAPAVGSAAKSTSVAPAARDALASVPPDAAPVGGRAAALHAHTISLDSAPAATPLATVPVAAMGGEATGNAAAEREPAGQPLLEPAAEAVPSADAAGTGAAATEPEPATPRSSELAPGISIVMPADAVRVAEETPAVPGAQGRITVKLKLSRGDAAALAEQLAAVSLAAPPTPPAKPVTQDALVGLVYDKCMEMHTGPQNHFERPARTAELFKLVTERGLAARCWTLPPHQATDEELMLVHPVEHIAAVEAGYEASVAAAAAASAAAAAGEGPLPAALGGGDMYYSEGTATAARTAAGCTISAAKWILDGEEPRSALAIVRPPGHHAECSCAMGFCFYNNVALAALSLLKRGVERVLIFDWACTEHILESDPRIMYMSLHRGNGFYPGTGKAEDVGTGAGRGFTVNVPWMRGGAGDRDYLAAWELVLGPIAIAFAPEVVLVSAGFDAAEGDPLGGCRVTAHGYARLTEALQKVANGRVQLALEGGYNTRATAEAAAACVEVLLGGPPPPPDAFAAPKPLKETQAALAAVAAAQAPFWPVLEPIASKEAFASRWDKHLASIKAPPPPPRALRSRTRGGRGNSKHIDFVVYT